LAAGLGGGVCVPTQGSRVQGKKVLFSTEIRRKTGIRHDQVGKVFDEERLIEKGEKRGGTPGEENL